MEETSRNSNIIIRRATREDCKAIMDLKLELAIHSDMGHLPMLSAKDLERDGFDKDPPCFQCIIAEVQPAKLTTDVGNNGGESESLPQSETNNSSDNVVGYALYFFAFAVWEGKALHLEDLCVSKRLRGGGIGKKLMKELAKIALEEKCCRIQFEVLNWNPSRKFYDSLGGWNTTEVEGWHNFRLDADKIKKLAES